MPRKKICRSSDLPYHIVNRTNNQDWFSIPVNECWEIFCDFLFLTQKQYDLLIHLFLLMSNHYHLMVSCPNGNLSEAMSFFQVNVAKYINSQTKRKNHLFGSNYRPWASIVHSEERNSKLLLEGVREDLFLPS